jgi:hypothetical protein
MWDGDRLDPYLGPGWSGWKPLLKLKQQQTYDFLNSRTTFKYDKQWGILIVDRNIFCTSDEFQS